MPSPNVPVLDAAESALTRLVEASVIALVVGSLGIGLARFASRPRER